MGRNNIYLCWLLACTTPNCKGEGNIDKKRSFHLITAKCPISYANLSKGVLMAKTNSIENMIQHSFDEVDHANAVKMNATKK